MIDVETIPHNPGCYLFKDSSKRVLYVGKAKDLKKRVSSYFQKNLPTKTKALMALADNVEFIATNSEVEALILENNLIKKYNPKYNIDLKDSKRYAYIDITDEPYPRLLIARRARGSGSFHGPFTSGANRDQILSTLIKTFQIRTCNKLPKRACLRYHINLCSAPCIFPQNEEYAKRINAAKSILKGDASNIIKQFSGEMKALSEKQEYEHALILKNQIDSLTWLSEKQTMERQKKYNEDILNFIIFEDTVYQMLFHITKGVLEGKQEFVFPYSADFLEEFLVQYYSDEQIPREIILPQDVDPAIVDFLAQRKGSTVTLVVPKQGEKKELLDLVKKNIELSYFADRSALIDLQGKLRLEDYPSVIECIDISHLSGTATVGSLVSFKEGKPDKSNYRRFKIQSVSGIDDFSSIGEVVKRRYSRLQKEQAQFPSLVIIDGGKGQLSAALGELRMLGIQIPIIALAKKFEEVYVPGLSRPLSIDKKSKAMNLLKQVRDEAHRFALSYNRLLRKKKIREQ